MRLFDIIELAKQNIKQPLDAKMYADDSQVKAKFNLTTINTAIIRAMLKNNSPNTNTR